MSRFIGSVRGKSKIAKADVDPAGIDPHVYASRVQVELAAVPVNLDLDQAYLLGRLLHAAVVSVRAQAFENVPIKEIVAALPNLPQRQDSVVEQARDLWAVANRLGCYDVADLLRSVVLHHDAIAKLGKEE
jgi:hypothetical protein